MSSAELLSRENNIARMRVVLDPATVDSAYKAVYKDLSSQLKVPGFRAGKIPANVIRQRVGAEAIDTEAADRLRQYALDYALEELDLSPRMGRPNFEVEPAVAAGTEAAFEISLPVLPVVTLPDFAEITVPVVKLSVTDQMAQRYRERLIERFTEYPPREDGAQAGDMLVLDVHSHFSEGGEESPFHAHGMAYKIGEDGNLPGWDEKLLGAKTADKLKFNYVMPGDFADVKIAGVSLEIEIEVHAVHSLIIPLLDEEFVKDKLKLEGLEQFETFMQTTLEREVEQQFEQQKRDRALQEVAEKLETSISEDMVKDEIDGIVTEHDRELRRHEMNLDDYLKQMGKTIAEFRDERKELAERRIRAFLAVKTIAEKEEIRATREDLMQYAIALMQREGFNQDQMKQLLSNREFMNETTYQIVRNKVLEHLANTVKFEVTEGTEDQAAAPSSEAGAKQ